MPTKTGRKRRNVRRLPPPRTATPTLLTREARDTNSTACRASQTVEISGIETSGKPNPIAPLTMPAPKIVTMIRISRTGSRSDRTDADGARRSDIVASG
jgi:hypothetical protein